MSKTKFCLPMTIIVVLVFSLELAAQQRQSEVVGAKPVVTDRGAHPARGRVIVAAKGPITGVQLRQLAQNGTIHGVIRRYNFVAMTPNGPQARAAIERLPFVAAVEGDAIRRLTDIGTWDRDIIDAVDVEENGIDGDPDAREVAQTGAGVHAAVIDTGLIAAWRVVLPAVRVRADLARAFMGGGAVADDFVPPDEFNTSNPTDMWEKDTDGHGTAVASHIIGFQRTANFVDGVAPGSIIIPLKVFPNGQAFTFDSRVIAAIAYATELKVNNTVGPLVINMSLGGDVPGFLFRTAIQDAIASGVIVVASAGNEGELGMGWPGAFPEVISAGATGWVAQFTPNGNRNWWRQLDVPETAENDLSFVPEFSSRAVQGLGPSLGVQEQQLDVLAPGYWTVAPLFFRGGAALFFITGTSFSSPLTAGVAALLLEKNPSLTQAQVEGILKATALPLPANGSKSGIIDPFVWASPRVISWDNDCRGTPCDAVGAGLVNAKAALAAPP